MVDRIGNVSGFSGGSTAQSSEEGLKNKPRPEQSLDKLQPISGASLQEPDIGPLSRENLPLSGRKGEKSKERESIELAPTGATTRRDAFNPDESETNKSEVPFMTESENTRPGFPNKAELEAKRREILNVVDLETKSRFQRAMGTSEKKSDHGHIGPESEKTRPTKALLEDVSSIISSSLSGVPHESKVEEKKIVESASNAQGTIKLDSELMAGLVSRILVTQPDSIDGEARIMIEPQLLLDTEIRLKRTPDGQLEVKFISGDEGAFQTLVATKDGLIRALERSGTPISFELIRKDELKEKESKETEKKLRRSARLASLKGREG
ncbi:MAG: hypothetical protein LBV23_10170 [Deltaproteobacteria bacterium]|jgi:hypothetical protein|nr:hypothetical protein [Deltaproteobacteria bacterium]